MRTNLKADALRKLLHYNRETGQFTWLVTNSRTKAGSIAGYLGSYGYWIIKVSQVKYMAHRLAWLYMTEEWPANEVDHIDRNRANNAWTNLRAATRKQNQENRGLGDMRGIRWEADRAKWLVRIKHNGTTMNLGRFICLDDAKAARRIAEDRFFTHVTPLPSCPDGPDPQGETRSACV